MSQVQNANGKLNEQQQQQQKNVSVDSKYSVYKEAPDASGEILNSTVVTVANTMSLTSAHRCRDAE